MSALSTRARAGLAKYNPGKGLKTIAVSEAAEKHFARAKDATNLQKAIRAKLEAQAEFVFWWDTQAERQQRGGDRRSEKQKDRSVFLKSGQAGIPEQKVIDRWRRKLSVSPEAFEATFQAAVARYVQILELDHDVHVNQNSGENEWYTPAEFVEAARTVLGGIDLDPATTQLTNDRVVKATHIFTRQTDGLAQPWYGRVWMNPPYGQPIIERFCEKFAHHAERDEITGIALVNNATDTAWFHRLASATMCFCFLRGRIRFWSPRGETETGLQGQVFCYTGADTVAFSAAFRPFGFITERTA